VGRLRVRHGEAHCAGRLDTSVHELHGVGLAGKAVGGGGEVALDRGKGHVLHELGRACLQGDGDGGGGGWRRELAEGGGVGGVA